MKCAAAIAACASSCRNEIGAHGPEFTFRFEWRPNATLCCSDMNKSRKVAPLELSDDEVKSLITETLLKAQNVFPKMKIEDLEVGARQPAGSEGVLSAWRISTNLGNFDISNNLRVVRIAPEPEARLKKNGSLPEVVQSLYSAWCSDWSTFSMDFDKKKDAGGWVHGRQVQTSEEILHFSKCLQFSVL